MKHSRHWPQKPKTKKSCCACSACTQALGCWKLISPLWCLVCSAGIFCLSIVARGFIVILLVRAVCCMYQLPFLTYKSRFIVLRDEVSVVAIVAGHLEMQHCNREVEAKGLISLCAQTQIATSQACTTTTCFIWFLKGNWKRKRGNNTALLSTSS